MAPLSSFLDRQFGVRFLPRLKQQVLGLAEDFWADGERPMLGLHFEKPGFLRKLELPKIPSFAKAGKKVAASPAAIPAAAAARKPTPASLPEAALWHAAPGEISEKMWGEGFVTPGDQTVNSLLTRPLGLTKEMSVLDLSAGLGERLRSTAKETGAYINGLEPDAAIAERGMQMSVKAGKSKQAVITAYDPATLVLNRAYDCIIARETFYRVADRAAFFAIIAKHTKPQGQLAFTDYILNQEDRDRPAVLAWRKKEPLANPMGLVEVAETLAKAGFKLRVNEDLTAFYQDEVIKGMKRLMVFLATGVKPDKETGMALLRRIETWQHRLAAMDAGVKFYRFYGTKQ